MPARLGAALSWLPDNGDAPLAAIFSLSGPELTKEEAALFVETNPLGVILFQRNIESPVRLKTLINEIRSTLNRSCPVLIDQEGGRVARLRKPNWFEIPAAKHFGDLYEQSPKLARTEIEKAYGTLADEMAEMGIDVNCAPVQDIMHEQTHRSVGDRIYSARPEVVAQCGHLVCEQFIKRGLTPVIKHMPGLGRANLDTHEALPRIPTAKEELAQTDFKPFMALAEKDYARFLWGMTTHFLYTDIDPGLPASVSPTIIGDIIRQQIGFDGFLISDDIDMNGMIDISPDFANVEKRALAALNAGTDAVLYCSGNLKDMDVLGRALPRLSDAALRRLSERRPQNTA